MASFGYDQFFPYFSKPEDSATPTQKKKVTYSQVSSMSSPQSSSVTKTSASVTPMQAAIRKRMKKYQDDPQQQQ